MKRYQQQYIALGSAVTLTLVTSKGITYANQIFDHLRQQIQAFEQQFSRFLPDSELSTFNTAAGKKTTLSPTFLALLGRAKQLGQQTDGLYNPFVLPALQRAGYLGSWPHPHIESDAPRVTERQVVPVEKLVIGKAWASMPATAALDFGGIGKGYLLDELAASLDKAELSGYWLSLGGDIICAGYDRDEAPWKIAVQHALQPDTVVDTITNSSGKRLAIATSGITKRRGEVNGEAWHHLIDPRTAKPVITSLLTATVTADQATIADVYAKCIIIAGSQQAKHYAAAGVISSYILQSQAASGTIEIEKG